MIEEEGETGKLFIDECLDNKKNKEGQIIVAEAIATFGYVDLDFANVIKDCVNESQCGDNIKLALDISDTYSQVYRAKSFSFDPLFEHFGRDDT